MKCKRNCRHAYQTSWLKKAVLSVLFLYTDGGPEHRENFVSVKFAMIALQRLNLD